MRKFIGKTMLALSLVCGGGVAVAADLKEVSFGLPSKSIVAAMPRVAEQLGLFEKYGIKPNFVYLSTTSGTATGLLSKSVDFGQTGVLEVITANSKSQPLVIVANHFQGAPGSLVLSKAAVAQIKVSPDAPIAERLKALDGLLIASTSAISHMTVTYKAASASTGASPRLVYMTVDAMPAALETGAIQGMIVTAPYWALAVERGTGVLWISPARGDVSPTFMPSSGAITATTRDFAKENPALVKQVMAMFEELSKMVAEKPDLVKAAFAKLYPELQPATLNHVLDVELKLFNAKTLTAKDVAHDIEFLKMSGIDAGPVDKVDPQSVLVSQPQ